MFMFCYMYMLHISSFEYYAVRKGCYINMMILIIVMMMRFILFSIKMFQDVISFPGLFV